MKYIFCLKRFKDANFIKQEYIHIHAERKINGYLNVLKFMKLFEKFESLKNLILNKHQSCAFDISNKRYLKDIYKDKAKSLYELFNYFNYNQRLQRNQNIIPDEKIKMLLDQEIKRLLNI